LSIEPQDVRASDVSFLPIVAAYVKKLGIVDQVDRLCPAMTDVSAGKVVMALILDTLAGRSPLYKLELSFVGQDTELLFGEEIAPAKFNDDAVGRSMDSLFEVGTGKILTAVVLSAIKQYNLDTLKVHHDTTSVTVYGDYDLYQDANHGHPFVITRGFNKDHRPDLKQIIQSLLCIDRGIPVAAKMMDGNRSDKTVNNNLLVDVAKKMKELGQNDPVYVADSALVTQDNLDLLADGEKGCRFITRLPRTYKECGSVVCWAMENNAWDDIGIISAQRYTGKRKPSYYHGFETEVDLYGRRYRSLVVHSDALDKKSVKKFEREMERDRDDLARIAQEQAKIGYACLADAHSALKRLHRGKFHFLSGEVYEVPHYPKGRPKAQIARTPTRIDYRLALSVEPDEVGIARSKREAGCFVLLTNIPKNSMSSYDILSTYKAQDMVERNFGFLKDQAIVNSLFLKTPARIEVLGLILVLSLMVWRLMERNMRLSLKSNGSTVQGWDKKATSSPTSLMITAFFKSMVVIRTQERRFLGNGLSSMQSEYLKILNVSSRVFTDPHG